MLSKRIEVIETAVDRREYGVSQLKGMITKNVNRLTAFQGEAEAFRESMATQIQELKGRLATVEGTVASEALIATGIDNEVKAHRDSIQGLRVDIDLVKSLDLLKVIDERINQAGASMATGLRITVVEEQVKQLQDTVKDQDARLVVLQAGPAPVLPVVDSEEKKESMTDANQALEISRDYPSFNWSCMIHTSPSFNLQ